MEPYNLPRTGSTPLAFEGTRLAHVSGADIPSAKKNPRWHEIDLYQTQAGDYVAHVAFLCDSRYDTERHDVIVSNRPSVIVAWLNDFEPVKHVRGWPILTHRQQDERLREKLTAAFRLIVTQSLAQTEAFSERI